MSRRTIVLSFVVVTVGLSLLIRLEQPSGFSRASGTSSVRPELAELVSALSTHMPTRMTDARLTGGFHYAPPPPVEGGSNRQEPPPAVVKAAAKIEQQALQASTPTNQAALGTAYLVTGKIDKAVETLESAVKLQPTNAHFHTDLSAAYLARARSTDRPEDVSNARAAAQRATEVNPMLQEAWFTLAVASEKQTPQDARVAWANYLALDHNSAWAGEARQHLDQLKQRPSIAMLPHSTVPLLMRPVAELEPVVVLPPNPALGPGAVVIPPYVYMTLATVPQPGSFPGALFVPTLTYCSGSLVGRKAILLAAHCLDFDGQQVQGVHGTSGTAQYRGTCQRHPQFREQSGTSDAPLYDINDLALCELEKDVLGVPFDEISIDPTKVPINAQVLITGFGCEHEKGCNTAKVQEPPTFRAGLVTITKEPDTADDHFVGSSKTGLCDGDSGGATFIGSNGLQSLYSSGSKVQVAVNSWVRCGPQSESNSGLTSLSTPSAIAFLQDWSAKHHAEICGVSKALSACIP